MNSNPIGMVRMLKAFTIKPHSRTQLMKYSGLSRSTIQKYVKLFHDEKLIRIAEWHVAGAARQPYPHFEWNYNHVPDAPKPIALTRQQINKRLTEKRKSKKHDFSYYINLR